MPDAPSPASAGLAASGPASADDFALQPDAATRMSRLLAVAALLALIALGLAWELWLAPTGRGTWALKVLPLLLPLGGLWHYRMRTYRWLALAVWLYFAEGVVRATSERGPGAALAALQGLLALLLFSACAWHVRWRLSRSSRRKEIDR